MTRKSAAVIVGLASGPPHGRHGWQVFTPKGIKRATRTGRVFEVAEVWARKDGAAAVTMTMTSDSGDWFHLVEYCYRAGGTIARVESTFNTFYVGGDAEGVSRRHVEVFDAAGKSVDKHVEALDLDTKKPTEAGFMNQEVPLYMTSGDLPFSSLVLQPPAAPGQGPEGPDAPPTRPSEPPLADNHGQPADRVLFMVFESALIPLGCSRSGALRSGLRCVHAHPSWNVWFPDSATSVEAVRMKRWPFPSDEGTVGYRLSTQSHKRNAVEKGDLTTFAIGGSPVGLHAAKVDAPVELLPGAAIRSGLPGHVPSPRTAVRVWARVDRILREAGLTSATQAGMLEYSIATGPGSVQGLYAVRVDPSGACEEESELAGCDLVRDLEMPDYLWLLMVEREGSIHRLQTGRSLYYEGRSASYRVGEGGAVLCIVDLDDDGVDELVIAQRYGEGIWYELLQRRGPTRFRRVSRFGTGG